MGNVYQLKILELEKFNYPIAMLVRASRVRWKRSSTASLEVKILELDKIGLGNTFLDVSSQRLSVRPRPSILMSVHFLTCLSIPPSVRPSVRPSVQKQKK